jgi:plastocyanin
MKNLVKRIMICAAPVIVAALLVAGDAPTIKLRDDCQPATFNLPPPDGAGPGTCAADFSGHTSFSKFIDELTKHQKAPEWRFDPSRREVDAGTQLSLDNYGGETHTFTRVQSFGGGFVLPLNGLSGNPIPAPECLSTSVAGTFVPAGAEDKPGPTLQNADRGKTVKFQCCIHPWMRTEIMVH